ncbi:MAG: DUF1778 domain-containing protein [Chloracidobacterium sp.]|nr:DUF1778 domain-containing protein [Chloracidobacterium sp.]
MTTAVSTKSRKGNIHIRISSDAREIIEKAVAASGQSLTDFATRSLLASATDVLEREYTTTLSNRDRDRLLKMLDADDKPNTGLRQAAKIHKKLILE